MTINFHRPRMQRRDDSLIGQIVAANMRLVVLTLAGATLAAGLHLSIQHPRRTTCWRSWTCATAWSWSATRSAAGWSSPNLRGVNPRVLLALFLLTVFALAAAVLAAGARDDQAEPETAGSRFAGSIMPKGVKAPDFELRDESGERVSMRGVRGRPVVVTFLYTTCDETCPAQAQTIRGALDQLGHDLPAIAVAVDPPRDTPERARAFLAKQRALGRISFALGSRDELRPVWKGFAIHPQTENLEHQARITLVDKRGFQRIGFPGEQATPERLAHDLRLLERE